MQLGTKEFIHCVHCVNHTLRLVASKEADQAQAGAHSGYGLLAQVYLLLCNWEVLLLASCEYGFTLDALAY